MPLITVGRRNSAAFRIHHEDDVFGSSVVLIHGHPLSAQSWEKQATALPAADRQVISYDRRGFTASGIGNLASWVCTVTDPGAVKVTAAMDTTDRHDLAGSEADTA
jgi:pimeloyl-ACP methyl ester carboxylesterase